MARGPLISSKKKEKHEVTVEDEEQTILISFFELGCDKNKGGVSLHVAMYHTCTKKSYG